MNKPPESNPAPSAAGERSGVDRPRVPRGRFGKLAIAMALVGCAVVGGYAAAAVTEYEPGQPERDELPASIRTTPGGYRSHHIWHTGFHGGK
jgi:hypothetical protein